MQPAPSFHSGASPNEQRVRLNELHRGLLTLYNDSTSSCSSQDGCSSRGALLPSLVRCQGLPFLTDVPSSLYGHSSRPLSRDSSVFLSCALHRFGLARSDSQTDRETDTHCDLPLPLTLSLGLDVLCAQLVPSRARFSSLWLPSTTTRDEPIIFQIKWAACATGCFYYIPPSINN